MLDLIPKSLREVANAIGEADAWRLAEAAHDHYEAMEASAVKAARPGRAFLYVPSTRPFPGWVVSAIGIDAAEALREEMPNAIVEVPSGVRSGCGVCNGACRA